MKIKLALALFAAIVASGIRYKLVTGECPIGAFCHAIHGDAKTQATTPAN